MYRYDFDESVVGGLLGTGTCGQLNDTLARAATKEAHRIWHAENRRIFWGKVKRTFDSGEVERVRDFV